jgi:tetratricopeptide (TPR) repeat protein
MWVPYRRSAQRAAFFILAGALLWAQSDELIRKSQLGRQFMADGKFADAIPIYQELVRAVPGNPGLLLNLGLAEHLAGRHRESIPHFQAVLRVQPGNFPALFSLGGAYLELNDPRSAADPLRKAVAADPSNPDAQGLLAGALMALHNYDEAAAQYRSLTKLTPADPRAWFGLGRCYEELAAQAFEALNKAAPQSPYLAVLLAESRVQQRQYRSAYFFYHQALDRSPNFPQVHAGLAEVYRRTDHADWAAQEDEREKAIRPDCAANPAACQFLEGRFLEVLSAKGATPATLYWRSKAANELAREAFAELGKLPDSPQIHEVKAGILRSQRQNLEAANEWRAAVQLAPGQPRYERELAVALHAAGDYKGALPLIEALLRNEANSVELNWLQGDSLLRLEEAERAIPYLEKAARLDPKYLPARASLGLALMNLGKGAQAIPHLEAALPLESDGSLQYQLARAYQAAGQAEKSRQAMAKYREFQDRTQAEKDELAKEAQIAPPHE